jgi:hypothetical protein
MGESIPLLQFAKKPSSSLLTVAFSCLLVGCSVLIVIAAIAHTNTRSSIMSERENNRLQMLWDFEQGGPTASDDAGENYNPVVVDDSISRAGYPSIDDGWQRWGCTGYGSLGDMYPCNNLPGKGKLDIDGLESISSH